MASCSAAPFTHDKVAKSPDYVLSLEDVRAWESRHGRIPEHAFVAMRTDWSKRWPDDASMQNKDEKGIAHYPGWSMAVLKLLYEDRHIAASGHETTDTDPGVATTKDDYSLESYVLGTNHYQIEIQNNHKQEPEYGALVLVSFPSPKAAVGSRPGSLLLVHSGPVAAPQERSRCLSKTNRPPPPPEVSSITCGTT